MAAVAIVGIVRESVWGIIGGVLGTFLSYTPQVIRAIKGQADAKPDPGDGEGHP